MSDSRNATPFSRRQALRWGALGVAAATVPWSLVGCGDSSGSSSGGSQPPGTVLDGPPKRGGTLKLGVTGGSPADTLDPMSVIGAVDVLRTQQLYDSLAEFADDRSIVMALAERITPSADGRTWTIVLKPGLQFHDGSPVDSDAVIFSIKRVIDPSAPKNGALGYADIDPGSIRKVDDQTVTVGLTRANFVLIEEFASYSNAIVPVGFDPKQPVGTGPFTYTSFTPGQQSTFGRNAHYWRNPDQPHVDSLVITEFSDATAQVNALLSGTINQAGGISAAQLLTVQANPTLKVVNRPSGAWFPFTMRSDVPPFDDARVRQAMRLIVNRDQMIQQTSSGQAKPGNDMWSPFDTAYDSSLPQRTPDIAKAKQLLADAGRAGLSVELVTSDLVPGLVDAAQVFAEQAKAAGVTVTVKKVEPVAFFTQDYLNSSFSQDIWDERPFFAQTGANLDVGSPFNPTKWRDPEFDALYDRAKSEPDATKRADLARQMQRILYDRGSYIVWSFPNIIDGFSTDVKGVEGRLQAAPLREAWLSS